MDWDSLWRTMVSFSLFKGLAAIALLPCLLAVVATASNGTSPALALGITKECLKGFVHPGTPKGRNVTIAGVNTYVAEPPKGHDKGPKKVIYFFSDVFSAVWINNELIQDYFASQGEHPHYQIDMSLVANHHALLQGTMSSVSITFSTTLSRITPTSTLSHLILIGIWTSGSRSRGGRLKRYFLGGSRLFAVDLVSAAFN